MESLADDRNIVHATVFSSTQSSTNRVLSDNILAMTILPVKPNVGAAATTPLQSPETLNSASSSPRPTAAPASPPRSGSRYCKTIGFSLVGGKSVHK